MRRRAVVVLTLLPVLASLVLAACGGSAVRRDKDGNPIDPKTGGQATTSPVTRPGESPGKTTESTGPLLSADVLVFSRDTLQSGVVEAIKALPGVAATTVFSMGQIYNGEQPITYAAVDPATFRRFTPPGTAQTPDVWKRLARHEMAIRPALGEKLVDPHGYIALGNGEEAEKIHVGAYADLTAPAPARTWVDAVVDESWAKRLHMPAGNALLLSMGNNAVEPIQKKLRALAGADVSIQILAHVFDISAVQTAVLTGTSLASAVGSFSYTANSNGTVNPDPRWVSTYIRREQVPILGMVTCNKVMLIQLRAALTEIVQRGLAGKIDPKDYGGCYYPRYIARDPSKGLSFHTWGTAIDLNVQGNLRGTVGLMDRSVVSIFKKWGFNWGGTWRYTDPMHFELARVVRVK